MPKGTDRERNLVDVLEDRKYRAFRAGASGGGTGKDRPDVIAGRDDIGRLLGIEAKAVEGNVYLRKSEFVQLLLFCEGPDGLNILPDDLVSEYTYEDDFEKEGFGCEPWFAFWWAYNSEYDHSFVFLRPDQILNKMGDNETKKSYRVDKDRALEIGYHREEFREPY